jgi:hypothetical protein
MSFLGATSLGTMAPLEHPPSQSLPIQQNTPNHQRKGVFLACAGLRSFAVSPASKEEPFVKLVW